MKKTLSLLLTLTLLFTLTVASAAGTNPSSMTDAALTEAYLALREEMVRRGLLTEDTLTLPEGQYVIGEDLAPGTYLITCTRSEGSDLADSYASLGSMYGSMGDDSGLAGLFGSLGSMMGSLYGVTVQIVGSYGSVQKSCELKEGESVTLTLTENTALKISGGSCKLEAK